MLGGERVHDLLHRFVDGVHAGNALDEALGQPDEVLAKDVTREVTQGGDYHQDGNGGEHVPEQGEALQRAGQVGLEKRSEGAADPRKQPAEHEPGDGERRQQEKAGEKGVAEGGEQTLVHEGK